MRGAGRAIFIATLLLIAGVLNMIYGIAAVANASFWVDNNNFVLSGLHTWGWVTIVIAVLQLVAALSLYGGRLFGRIIGIFGARPGRDRRAAGRRRRVSVLVARRLRPVPVVPARAVRLRRARRGVGAQVRIVEVQKDSSTSRTIEARPLR